MEQYTIKSVAFGGFDKEDVARYIEQISQETEKLREERDALREQAESAAQEVEALREQVQQLTAAKAQLETEVQRLASAEEENADLRSQLETLRPDAEVDAILAKRNLGTKITDAPIVVGIGPGFTAGEDCHAVVETMRSHTLGRVIYQGSALLNTNIPGLIGGYAGERVLRAPDDGIFHTVLDIGAQVKSGDVAGQVNGKPMVCTIDGVLRGLLADGTPVFKGMKSGDVDPRCREEYCYTASDKALAVGGGVLEAVLHFYG